MKTSHYSYQTFIVLVDSTAQGKYVRGGKSFRAAEAEATKYAKKNIVPENTKRLFAHGYQGMDGDDYLFAFSTINRDLQLNLNNS